MERGPESTVTARFRRRCVPERMASIWTLAEFSTFSKDLNFSTESLRLVVDWFVRLAHVDS